MSEISESTPREDAPTSEPRAEPDAPRTAFIFVFAVCGVAVLGLMVLIVEQAFNLSLREEIAQKVLRPQSSALRQLRAEEQAKLRRYQWVDQKAGQLRIPLDRAVELTLLEWKSRSAGFAPGAPSLPAPASPPAAATPGASGAAPGAGGAHAPSAPGRRP